MLKKFASDLSHGLRTMVRGLDADWDFRERRKTIRFRCRYKVDVTKADETKPVYVIDYSMGGLRFSTTLKYKVGDEVSIRFPTPLPEVSVSSLHCEIVYSRRNPKTLENVYGVKFKETKQRMSASWIAYFFREKNATSHDLVEHRAHFRISCSVEIVARAADERAVGTMTNLSTEGCCIVINRPAEPDDIWGIDISGISSIQAVHIKGTVLSCELEETGLYRQRIKFPNPLGEATDTILRSYMLALTKDFWTE